jgi:hypothetical protein
MYAMYSSVTDTACLPAFLQREHEDRRALFSCYYWACHSWNLHRQQQQQLQPPGPGLWRQLLASLQLSRQQQAAWLAARSELLRELQAVAAEWREVLASLALELLRYPQVRGGGLAGLAGQGRAGLGRQGRQSWQGRQGRLGWLGWLGCAYMHAACVDVGWAACKHVCADLCAGAARTCVGSVCCAQHSGWQLLHAGCAARAAEVCSLAPVIKACASPACLSALNAC